MTKEYHQTNWEKPFPRFPLACLLALSCLLPAGAIALDGDRAAPATITVFTASSAADVLASVAKKYEESHPVTIRFSSAASSILARQIEQGAPCDIFLSADQSWMDYLAGKHRIQPGSRKDVAANRLVIVTPVNRPLAIRMDKGFDLAGAFSGRLAIGDPDHVPAGIYAREALQTLGWWDPLKNRLVSAENVRAALRLVELGEVNAGVVYLTDARSSGKVAVAGQFPVTAHRAIRYPVALCVTAGAKAGAFLDYLTGRDASSVWTAAGFISLAP